MARAARTTSAVDASPTRRRARPGLLLLSPPRAARLHVERLAARDAPPPRRPKIKMTYIKHIVLALAMATAAAETPKLRGRVLEEDVDKLSNIGSTPNIELIRPIEGLIGLDGVPAQIGALLRAHITPFPFPTMKPATRQLTVSALLPESELPPPPSNYASS